MEKQRYITIQEWMLALDIKGSELLAFALVWGFSQDGVSVYRGGSSYAARWLGITKDNARAVLNRLAGKGLLEKIEVVEQGVKFCNWRVNRTAVISMEAPLKQGIPTPKTMVPPTPKTGDNNDSIDILSNSNRNKMGNNTAPSFDFLFALIELGVSEQTASDWMKVRKAARAVDTETAFRRIEAEIEKTGADAEDCIALAVAKNWRGFEAAWYKNATTSHPRCAAPSLHDLDPVTAMGIQAGIIEPYDYER